MEKRPSDKYNGIAILDAPQVASKSKDPWSNLSEKDEILDALADSLQTLRDHLKDKVHNNDAYYRARQVYRKHHESKHRVY
jgi:hypothetical protein